MPRNRVGSISGVLLGNSMFLLALAKLKTVPQ